MQSVLYREVPLHVFDTVHSMVEGACIGSLCCDHHSEM